MDKKKIGRGMQIVAFLIFIVMALASGTVKTTTTEQLGGNNHNPNDGATIETPADSISATHDLASN